MRTGPRALPALAALVEPAALSQALGRPVDAARVEPLAGVGYSNASHSRVVASWQGADLGAFVLKRAVLERDWTARRTGDDRGREALLAGEAAFAGVWDAFACPYVACASEPGEIGLLLEDLTPYLLPDVRQPLSIEQETALLGALARLHARFWRLDSAPYPWLARSAHYCDVLAPAVAGDPASLLVLSDVLRASVPRGWTAALDRLPPAVRTHLTRPGRDWETAWADLPATLLHGDVKVANFAILPDGCVAAFDWAMAGAGPCAIDVGWYLAVNATRLTDSKEAVLRRYRALLESAMEERLPNATWNRLESVAVVTGARMLLWSKALAVEADRSGAAAEWTWWVDRLLGIEAPA